ncbi:MAG: hypothetical protein EOP49_14010 [Sphingobacteriales bacterium]|nr:MAG: hypothetical protein EOP49_14010 [Sphingobacteriales bacterium]
MERNFYNDDFEELLKEKADQYKMYPSDKVWNGIQNALHSRRKWYWLGFALLLSGVSYYAIEALVAPPRITAPAENTSIASTVSISSKEHTDSKNTKHPALVIPLTAAKPVDADGSQQTNDLPFYGVFSIDRSYSSLVPGATARVVEMLRMVKISIQPKALPVLSPAILPQQAMISKASDPALNPLRTGTMLSAATIFNTRTIPGYYPEIIIDNFSNAANTSDAGVATHPGGNQLRFPMEAEPSNEDLAKINWLQEYATIELEVPRTKRTSLQISFAPTMNYRKLSTSKNPGRASMVKNFPMALNVHGDIEKLVNHKPALGFELGSHMRYAVNRTVTVKAGLQFNYARYAIEAFSSPAMEEATIALNATGSVPRRDSIISMSSISNFGGNSVRDIQNQYFQLSAPIGLELKLIGGQKLQLHVAGTIQPTYLINRNTYLITTDYQNYTREPSLVRRWNMNTSAEAFVSYNTGTVTWQVGPQFRYQLLSSYSSRYPIRENLMEYGVKIGVSKTIR